MRLALILLAASAAATDTTIYDLQQRAYDVEKNWFPFVRELYGCPENFTGYQDCRPDTGHIDYEHYKKAREAAKRLFDLGEKR